jgi:TPR repeat protein
MYKKYQHEGYVYAYLRATSGGQSMLNDEVMSNAQAGNPMAQSDYGYMYANGIGRQVNYERAYAWFSKSSMQGYHAGIYNMAACYEHGEGTNQDSVTALKYYTLAAKNGYLPAILKLALLKVNGIVQHSNPKSAIKQIMQSAKSGNPEDMFILGICHDVGFCVSEDINITERLMTESAERNYVPAQIFLRNHFFEISEELPDIPLEPNQLSLRQMMLIWNFILLTVHGNKYHDWLSHYLKIETAGYQLQFPRSPDSNNVCRMHTILSLKNTRILNFIRLTSHLQTGTAP